MRVISFGAGVQTTALAILTVQGRVPEPAEHMVFADTGGEKDETYAYLREVFEPWAAAQGRSLTTVAHPGETLYEYAWRRWMVPSINTRWCTTEFKVRVINRWLREMGATRHDPAVLQIGISLDERHRARDTSPLRYVRRRWPLIELELTRADCHRIIRDAGLPDPPKSGCYFCPYQSIAGWKRLAAEHPEHFAQAVALEQRAQERNPRDMLLGGRKRIADLIAGGRQLAMEWDAYVETEAGCESGHCFV